MKDPDGVYESISSYLETTRPDFIPFSVAGKQGAQDDDRHLWPAMLRIIKECRPRWVVGENVTGIINLALEEVCLDLEGEGYEVWPIIIPACAVNAPHRRDRFWIIANSNSKRSQRREKKTKGWERVECEKQFERFCNNNDWKDLPKPGISRGDDGFSSRMDKCKALGNAIVPQVAYEIIKQTIAL